MPIPRPHIGPGVKPPGGGLTEKGRYKIPDSNPLPSYGDGGGYTIRRQVTLNVSDTAENRCCPVVYGWARYRPMVLDIEVDGTTLHVVYLLSEGEIQSLEKVTIGGTEVYPTTVSWCTASVVLGTTGQSEFTGVPATLWSSAYPGRAMLYLTLDLTAAKMVGGMPDCEVTVKGRKVYDPRTATSAFSENPILVTRDLMTSAEYGGNVSTAKIATTNWNDAATRCDETVDTAARWRCSLVVQDRRDVLEVVRDLLKTTCGGTLYWADGLWYVWLDEQHLVGCRPTGTSAVGTTDRAQSFEAPGPRIKPVLKLNLAVGFTDPTLRLRSTLGGADLATATVTGLSSGDNQEITFDLSSYSLTTGNTYYLVLNATVGVTWHQKAADSYADGSAWNYTAGAWAEEATKDFWFQCHYADFDLVDALTATAGQVPILGSRAVSSLSFARSRQETPNVVELTYFDVSDWVVKPVRIESSGVQAGTDQERAYRQQLLSVPSSSCAYRLGRQWYYRFQRTLKAACTVPQHGIQIAPGAVCSLTSTVGPVTAQWFLVLGVTRRLGAFDLALVEYNWTDYSREETVTLDTITIPSAVSTTKYQKIADDFVRGGTTSGVVGEQLWSMDANAAVSYDTETDHAGIVKVTSASAGPNAIKLDAEGCKFAPKSVWRQKWIVKFNSIAAGTYYRAVSGVFEWRFTRDDPAGTYSLLVDGVDTGTNVTADTWLTIEAWCDGGGTAYWTLVQGATTEDGSKAVADTTPTAYLSGLLTGVTAVTAAELDIDYVSLVQPTSR